MKKPLPLILGGLVVLGVGWFLIKGRGGVIPTKSDLFTGSLAAAVKLGVPMKCTYKIGDLEAEGYVKGKLYRGKMQAADGQTTDVIINDNCMWTWGGDQPGTKFCTDPAEGPLIDESDVGDTAPDTGGYTAPDMEFSCLPAAVSDDLFTPPADVEFIDFNAALDETLMQLPDTTDIPDFPDIPELPEY